jgi:hypothetical protein
VTSTPPLRRSDFVRTTPLEPYHDAWGEKRPATSKAYEEGATYSKVGDVYILKLQESTSLQQGIGDMQTALSHAEEVVKKSRESLELADTGSDVAGAFKIVKQERGFMASKRQPQHPCSLYIMGCKTIYICALLSCVQHTYLRTTGDLEQSGVISLTGQGPTSTVDTFHEQSRHSLFFTPWNQLHYDMQITTAAHLEKALTENLTRMGEIAGRSSKEIVSQTDAQRRMLLVEVDSPTMKAKDSPSRAKP